MPDEILETMKKTRRLPLTVGCEIEFCGIDEAVAQGNATREVLRALRGAGLETSGPMGWKLKGEISCTGFEIISPILSTEDDLNQINVAAEALAKIGAVIDKRCGYHVHIGMTSTSEVTVSKDGFLDLFKFLTRYESAFFCLVPPVRYEDKSVYRFCQHLRPDHVKRLKTENLLFQAWDFGRGRFDRYYWINGMSYNRFQTLEFRLMEGTLDTDILRGWIDLILQVCVAALSGKSVKWGKAAAMNKKMLVGTLLQQANCYGKDATERAIRARKFATTRLHQLDPHPERIRNLP